MIETDQMLASFLPELQGAPWIALDTEADSLHAYPEKLCLIQISIPGRDVLVDPLTGMSIRPLLDVLQPRTLILHGSDYDLRLFRKWHNFVPSTIFDTMLAARLLGITEFGLTNLVSRFLDVTLQKGSQKADWARRPLTERMVEYAHNDTRYLYPLAEKLRLELEAKGRLEWHRQTCAQLVEDCAILREPEPDTAWRLKGSDRIDRRAMAVLREMWKWREQEAIAANKPPFYVLNHELMVTLAVQSLLNPLEEIQLPRYLSPRRQAGLRAAMAEGLALPAAQWPERRRFEVHRPNAAEKRRFEVLRQRRDDHAAKLGIDPSLIGSKATLSALAEDWDKHVAELMPWQRELLTA